MPVLPSPWVLSLLGSMLLRSPRSGETIPTGESTLTRTRSRSRSSSRQQSAWLPERRSFSLPFAFATSTAAVQSVFFLGSSRSSVLISTTKDNSLYISLLELVRRKSLFNVVCPANPLRFFSPACSLPLQITPPDDNQRFEQILRLGGSGQCQRSSRQRTDGRGRLQDATTTGRHSKFEHRRGQR